MATKTSNYLLTKPEGTDFYDIEVQNENMDIIDKEMKINADAIETINDEKKEFATKTEVKNIIPKDTGWITVTNFYNGCTHYDTDLEKNKVQMRQIGNAVMISGTVKNKIILPTGNNTVDMFKIPDEIDSPHRKNTVFVQQGSGANKFCMIVGKEERYVAIERYGTTSIIDTPVNSWLNVSCVYMV